MVLLSISREMDPVEMNALRKIPPRRIVERPRSTRSLSSSPRVRVLMAGFRARSRQTVASTARNTGRRSDSIKVLPAIENSLEIIAHRLDVGGFLFCAGFP